MFCRLTQKYYFCRRVSPARHAPFEFPQGLIAARVEGCSGAMQGAYPLASLAQLARARDL
jgi:hypothetical protein